MASTVPTPPDDIAAHVARVADGFRGEARRAHGAAWRWSGASIAGFLAVAWFDAVTDLISVLTTTSGFSRRTQACSAGRVIVSR